MNGYLSAIGFFDTLVSLNQRYFQMGRELVCSLSKRSRRDQKVWSVEFYSQSKEEHQGGDDGDGNQGHSGEHWQDWNDEHKSCFGCMLFFFFFFLISL